MHHLDHGGQGHGRVGIEEDAVGFVADAVGRQADAARLCKQPLQGGARFGGDQGAQGPESSGIGREGSHRRIRRRRQDRQQLPAVKTGR